ncbi:MAG: hypothetical protein NDI94_01615 [Candidatus Woesearchaeota archaeon]|nr:hypothetical protein [Candidatus Woesearchaeota archaeon]
MIGKPEWFQRRKYSGWGLSPKTWQGYAYIAVLIAILFGLQLLPVAGNTKVIIMIVFAAIIALDTIDIMMRLKKDEREIVHEAIAERNVAWFIIIVIAVGIAYQSSQSAVLGKNVVDPFLIIAILGGMIVKVASNIYLDRKR